jgi:hypothetical protein
MLMHGGSTKMNIGDYESFTYDRISEGRQERWTIYAPREFVREDDNGNLSIPNFDAVCERVAARFETQMPVAKNIYLTAQDFEGLS